MAKRIKQRHVRCLEKHREDLCVSTPNALYVATFVSWGWRFAAQFRTEVSLFHSETR